MSAVRASPDGRPGPQHPVTFVQDDSADGNATTGDASADAINTGDATAVSGDATGKGGTVKKTDIKKQLKENLKAKLGH